MHKAFHIKIRLFRDLFEYQNLRSKRKEKRMLDFRNKIIKKMIIFSVAILDSL